MAEQIDLTTPEGTKPGTPYYRISLLILNYDAGTINIDVVGANGFHRTFFYENAQTQIQALNTANLTIKSLQRRILEKLVADGKLVGTISGVP